MATILNNATSTGTGTWQQASPDPSYVRVTVEGQDADAQLTLLSSETSGAGIGSDPAEEESVIAPQSDIDETFIFPAGSYYLNARIDRIDGDTTVNVEIVN
jgi:hypothetical protein